MHTDQPTLSCVDGRIVTSFLRSPRQHMGFQCGSELKQPLGCWAAAVVDFNSYCCLAAYLLLCGLFGGGLGAAAARRTAEHFWCVRSQGPASH